MSTRGATAVFLVLLFVCGAGMVLSGRELHRPGTRLPLQDFLYIPSPKTLKRLSLGYTGLLADIYWTRVVQYYGGKHHNYSREYQLLKPLLDITSELDPHLTVAYEFGSFFLAQKPPEGAGLPREAAAYVEHGIRQNPNDWRLYYDLGFIYWLELKDYAAAADAFDRGSRVPGAHPFMKVMAATMAQHGGDAQTARYLWTQIYQTTEDKMIRANAVKRLQALDSDEDVTRLENMVRVYTEKTGHRPASIAELVAAGWLKRVPLDPAGHPYKLMPDGRVEVQSPDEVPFITKGLPPGKEAWMFADPSKMKQ